MAIFRYWRHFLALESDFSAISRFVEFSKDNYKTYSIEFVKLLLAVGSEVDVVAKDVCAALDPSGSHDNINDYRKCISVRHPVCNDKVLVRRYELEFQPWREWHGETNPHWWWAYNKVKHERTAYFKEANLENCANAIGGLFAMILYCWKAEASQDVLEPEPLLVDWYMNYNVRGNIGPYLPQYHIYAFQPPFDKTKIVLT